MSPHSKISKRLHLALGKLIEGTENGVRLPSEPELSKELGVSRATLREAMRTFETQGLIRRRQGSGTYVSRPSQIIESGIEVLESIETLADRIGLPVSMGKSTISLREVNKKEMDVLGLTSSDLVTCVSRVILADGQPCAYLIDVFPENYLTDEELESKFRGSILDLFLNRLDSVNMSSKCEIQAVTASSEIARALTIQRGDVLLCFEAVLFDQHGKGIDHSFSYFLPGYFKFHVVRRVG